MSNEVAQLEKLLDDADTMYYTFGASELSDSEYDSYVDRLRQLDPKNKRFKDKKVGAKEDKKSGWEKYKHDEFPMGSQSKTNDNDGLVKWSESNSAPYYTQEKLDGISIKMIFENGKLSVAATRGDGEEGEDITQNVKKMGGVPSSISDTRKLVIRGEILLYESNFEHVGGKNKRNVASGTAKRSDGKGCEYLDVQVYDIMNWSELNLKHHGEALKLLKSLGFQIVNTKLCKTIDDVQKVMDDYIDSTRDSLDWDIDGLVVKAAILQKDDWRYPSRSIAYKFPNQMSSTKLLDVKWKDTGGRISPVGILEPVDIAGVTISKATLNNIDHINRLGIKIGDTVLVSRRNDVIPCIEKVAVADPNGVKIEAPTEDEDGFAIVRETNTEGKELAYLVSTNPNSRSKRHRTILAWFTTHGCKGIAGATVDAIMDAGIADDLPSFYDMCLNGDTRLLDLDGFGNSTFKMLHQNILKTSKTNLIDFLLGCDVSGFGEKRFELILEHFNEEMDLDTFIDRIEDVDEVGSISGLGVNTAKSLRNTIKNKIDLLRSMQTRVDIEPWKPGEVNTNTKIAGMTFCFTGKMAHGRSELEKLVKANAGIIAGVSKKLDYLVTNDPNSGSSKNKKADSLGITKITEQQFLNIVGG
jgi:DNA ligase (NAD+)